MKISTILPAGTSAVPPIARGWIPIAGHLVSLGIHPLEFLQQARVEGDVLRLRMGHKGFYLINSSSTIRQMLVDDAEKFGKGVLYDRVRPLLGNGLVNSDGTFHHRQRRLMQPAFNRKHIEQYMAIMTRHAMELSDSWADGRTIVLTNELRQLSSDNIANTLFPDASSTPAVAEFQRSLSVVLDGLIIRALAPYRIWEYVPTAGNRRYGRAIKRLRDSSAQLIDTARSGEASADGLLSLLARARDPDTGDVMTDQQLLDEVVTLFSAGSETASVTLSWLFYELSRHRKIETRLHEELDTHFADGPTDLASLERLPLCRRIVEETLRLHTPTWFLSRRTLDRVKLGKWEIPAGAEIIYSPTTLHRDPAMFDDPMSFDPDRWLPERRSAGSTFIPFNLGVRKCIGDHFAMTEMMVTVAVLASSWRLRVPLNHADVREHVSTTVHPGALVMTTRARGASRDNERQQHQPT